MHAVGFSLGRKTAQGEGDEMPEKGSENDNGGICDQENHSRGQCLNHVVVWYVH